MPPCLCPYQVTLHSKVICRRAYGELQQATGFRYVHSAFETVKIASSLLKAPPEVMTLETTPHEYSADVNAPAAGHGELTESGAKDGQLSRRSRNQQRRNLAKFTTLCILCWLQRQTLSLRAMSLM